MEKPPTAPEQAMVSAAGESNKRRSRPVWGVPIAVIAVVAIVVLFVVGFTGLFANPVRSVSVDGTATLSGSFEPYQCGATSCDGYISAGARSVFVSAAASSTLAGPGSAGIRSASAMAR